MFLSLYTRSLLCVSQAMSLFPTATNVCLAQNPHHILPLYISTEDGSEHSNSFIRNLGVHTKKATRLIVTERGETDDGPGTFWMTNMQNSLLVCLFLCYASSYMIVFTHSLNVLTLNHECSEGNVMAGSEHYGFFIEGHRKINEPSRYQDPDLNPMRTTPTLFKDNIIHGSKAFQMTTYPKGWNPPTTALLENLCVYRGLSTGMCIYCHLLIAASFMLLTRIHLLWCRNVHPQ